MTFKEIAFYFTPVGVLAVGSVWFVHGLELAVGAVLVAFGVFVGGLALRGSAARQGRSAKWHVVSLGASIALTASEVIYEWPLKTAYALSQPAMERIAVELTAGRRIEGPTWVGAFRVEKAEYRKFPSRSSCEIYSPVVCLWLDADSAGPTGLVQCDRQMPPFLFNVGWLTSIDERWQLVQED